MNPGNGVLLYGHLARRITAKFKYDLAVFLKLRSCLHDKEMLGEDVPRCDYLNLHVAVARSGSLVQRLSLLEGITASIA